VDGKFLWKILENISGIVSFIKKSLKVESLSMHYIFSTHTQQKLKKESYSI
jgi:hypothetical protein